MLIKPPPLSLVFSIAVLCGIVHGVIRFRNEPSDVTVASAVGPQKTTSGASSRRRGHRQPAIPKPAPSTSTPLTVAAGEELTADLDAATAAIAEGSYLKAIASTRLVETALQGRSGAAVDRLLRETTITAARARLYRAFTRSIQAHEFLADGAGRLREVTLVGVPEPITALLIEAQEDQVILELDDGSRRTYASERVSSMEFMTADRYRTRVTKFIDSRLRTLTPSSPLELFRLAYTCFQHELVRQGTDLLDLAVAAPEPDVLLVFAEGSPQDNLRALRLLAPKSEHASSGDDPALTALRTPTGPQTDAARPTARTPRRPRRERPASRPPAQPSPDTTSPAPSPTASSEPGRAHTKGVGRDPTFLEARRLFDEATNHYRRSLRSLNSASGQAELRAASQLLEQVMELYSKLAEKHPHDTVLEQAAQHAQQMLYDCNKSLKVD